MRTNSNSEARDRLAGSSDADELTARLCRAYPSLSPAMVRTYVDAEYLRLGDSRLQSFVTILVERAVRERLGRPPATPAAA